MLPGSATPSTVTSTPKSQGQLVMIIVWAEVGGIATQSYMTSIHQRAKAKQAIVSCHLDSGPVH